jgi:UDP-glucose 4-epimerase
MVTLVTGGAGYIGSHMVLALLDAGREVVVLDNLTTGQRELVPAGVPLYVDDIAHSAAVLDLIARYGIDAVVHFAGSVVVPESITDPLGYYLNNTVRTRALVAACVHSGVKRFIFSSTAAVYGIPEANPVGEDEPLAPISPYGTSKMMTELMLRDVAVAHDLRYVALRYFNVAGADPGGRSGQTSPRATHLIKVACEAALGIRDGVEIFGDDYPTPDGTGVRDYIHVADLADAHVLALDYLESGGESVAFNCGYGRGYSVREVIAAVKRVSGVDFAFRHDARRAGDPPALVAKTELLRAKLAWRPRFDDLDTIVSHALRWERNRKNYSGPRPDREENLVQW